MIERLRSYLDWAGVLTAITGVFLAASIGLIVSYLSQPTTELSFAKWVTAQTAMHDLTWVLLIAYSLLTIYSITFSFKTIYDSFADAVQEGSNQLKIQARYPVLLFSGSLFFTVAINLLVSNLLLPTLLGFFVIVLWSLMLVKYLGEPHIEFSIRLK